MFFCHQLGASLPYCSDLPLAVTFVAAFTPPDFQCQISSDDAVLCFCNRQRVQILQVFVSPEFGCRVWSSWMHYLESQPSASVGVNGPITRCFRPQFQQRSSGLQLHDQAN